MIFFAPLLSWLAGPALKWLALAVFLAGAVAWHQHSAGQAIAGAVAAADRRWREALAKQEAEARIEFAALQGRADEAGHAAAASLAATDALQRQIEADNASLPENHKECLDVGRARLLNRL